MPGRVGEGLGDGEAAAVAVGVLVATATVSVGDGETLGGGGVQEATRAKHVAAARRRMVTLSTRLLEDASEGIEPAVRVLLEDELAAALIEVVQPAFVAQTEGALSERSLAHDTGPEG
jgi:hypothetical protein